MSKTLHVKFILFRDSNEERTFARVNAQVFDQSLTDQEEFKQALRAALTEWSTKTKEGTEAWACSAGYFNIGDLANHLGDNKLKRFLTKNGIFNLSIEIDSKVSGCPWDFDDILMDAR